MDRLKIEDVEPWLLSGKPVVRLAGRDFDQTVDEYMEWLKSVSESLRLNIAVKPIVDPPGVVVQAYVKDAPVLEDPLLSVSKKNTGWLFCLYNKCRNRVPVPGMMCQAHQ